MNLIELLYRGETPKLINRLKSGADPNVAKGGESLLYGAIDKGKWSLVKLLLKCGASPDLPGTTPPLALAAAKGKIDVVALLLLAGAEVDARDEEGATALMDAAAAGHAEIAAQLLEAGANAKAKDVHGKTAILYAAKKEQSAVLELLLPRSSKSDQQIVKNMLTAKATEANPEDVYGLLRAARVGAAPLVREFLDDGVPVDACDGGGTTALMNAANAGSLRAVKLLVDRGANVNYINFNGEGPLTFAALGGHAEVYDFLETLTADKKLRRRAERIKAVMIDRGDWKLPEVWD